MTGQAVPRDYGAAARTKATERALDAAIAAFLWGFRIIVVLVIVVGSYLTLSSGKYSVDTWIDLLVDGASLGGVYALIALGYTMVYGILRMINFAHGDVFMIGAFAGYYSAIFLRNIGFLNSSPAASVISIAIMMAVAAVVAVVGRRAHRAHRLPSPAQLAATGAAHRRHRRVILPAVHRERASSAPASSPTRCPRSCRSLWHSPSPKRCA